MRPASGQKADGSSIRYEGWRIVGVCFLLESFGWAFGALQVAGAALILSRRR